MDINKPFETFEKSAFRLEGLPHYIVKEEKEPIKYFHETGVIRMSDSSWPDLVSKNIKAGKKMERLRLLSDKLTDYERYELQAYRGPGVGETIRTDLKSEYADKYSYDFWFFDDEWIAQVNYKEDGTFVNFDIRKATDEEKEMFRYWHSVFESAKPLRQVPFVSNTSDDLHCLQAAYMSIAKYFDPNFNLPMDEWSRITGYEEGKGTWGNAGLVWFKNQGYDVKHISLFDYEEFVKRPKEYLYEVNGEEAGKWAYEHSNIPAEIPRVEELLKTGIIERREPMMADIKRLLDEGYLVRISLNCEKLDGREGYVGHAVTVTSYNEKFLTFHDPGLSPIPNRQATFEEFEAAWADPNAEVKELDAIRRPEPKE